jgi:hypothetical protein
MAAIRISMTTNIHRKPVMDQCRMWRTEGIVGDVDRYQCEHGDDVVSDQ